MNRRNLAHGGSGENEMLRTWLASLFIVVIVASPAFADDITAAATGDPIGPRSTPATRPPSRGPILPMLYISLAALNVYDGSSTTRALKRGAAEANPMLVGISGNPAALWAVKAGVTAGTIVTAERLWRQHRRGAAIGMMIVSNGLMAAVAAQNASVIRRLR
jgi:hypothetical protein